MCSAAMNGDLLVVVHMSHTVIVYSRWFNKSDSADYIHISSLMCLSPRCTDATYVCLSAIVQFISVVSSRSITVRCSPPG